MRSWHGPADVFHDTFPLTGLAPGVKVDRDEGFDHRLLSRGELHHRLNSDLVHEAPAECQRESP